jgi:hypothetical protein
MCFVVLLRDCTLTIVECNRGDIFDVARERDAGICGVFEDRAPAEALVASEQMRVAR